MLSGIRNWLEIYEDEADLFFWTVVLRILLMSAFVILNNYAETTFLQRYGVEKLPLMYLISPVLGILLMGMLAGFMVKLPGAHLLSGLFLAFGAVAAGIRFLIPLNIDLIYPALFLLKIQCEAILGLLFLNLANDLFNIRQSKRLFPLIYAGGYLGYISISFLTPVFSRLFSFDNLLLLFAFITLLAAGVLLQMGRLFPTLLVKGKKSAKGRKKKRVADQVKDAWPFIRKSLLIKILVLLFLLPNVTLVIMNFQFNFVVDAHFATESAKLSFFGYFRGVLGIINLILLLFVGKLYGRWGLPVALLFHPANYMIAFFAFIFSFSWLSGMYARLSTQILKSTVFIPARSILMGLLPEEQRAIMMPFLRGVVIRAGSVLGSLLLMGFGIVLDARWMSLVALPFVAVWMAVPIILKKNYAAILSDLISRNVLDVKSMEKKDMESLFRDRRIRRQLTDAFCAARGGECLWYAELLKSLGEKELDPCILRILKAQDDRTRIELLQLLSSDPEGQAMAVLADLIDEGKPELTAAVIASANRLALPAASRFNQEAYRRSDSVEVKAAAVAGLCRSGAEAFCRIIHSWLASDDPDECRAGVLAAGGSGQGTYQRALKKCLLNAENEPFVEHIIDSLQRTGGVNPNHLLEPFLSHPRETVRGAALNAYDIQDDHAARVAIHCMGDPSPDISRRAREKLATAPYHNPQLLVESLNLPRRKIREGIFVLLETLNTGDVEVFRFARRRINECFYLLVMLEHFKTFPEGPLCGLIMDHLRQQRDLNIENVLRVMALQDRSGRIKLVVRGILSADKLQRANSIEALDNAMDRSLSRLLIPLLDDTSRAQKIYRLKKHLALPGFIDSDSGILSWFAEKKDNLSVALVLALMMEQQRGDFPQQLIRKLNALGDPHILDLTKAVALRQTGAASAEEPPMDTEVALSDKILLLKKIDIFEGLSVAELSAVGSVTEQVFHKAQEIVIRAGEIGETMFLILDGEVSVHIPDQTGGEIEVDRIRSGDYFGEMALFENIPRTATVRTQTRTRLLVLHKQEFNEIVREYPQIALEICKVLSARIRKLHGRIKQEKTA